MKMPWILLTLALVGCSTGSDRLSEFGSQVLITDKLPPIKCRLIGEVYGSHMDQGDQLEAIVKGVRNKLRNQTATRGGNYVRIVTNNTTTYRSKSVVAMSGTAYDCSPEVSGSSSPGVK